MLVYCDDQVKYFVSVKQDGAHDTQTVSVCKPEYNYYNLPQSFTLIFDELITIYMSNLLDDNYSVY